MRLKHIKIAGFKSFVDPTTLVLPENMTCIVGPNGCGKSNTIDAVRWVMGESSAKHLRGDSITDVIFSGSADRKPVSQASVELLFDNSSQKIVGEYAAYTEISVKRVVTREGQSQYYLNNTKCRRRDVTDLFLGTGLGPRSYAIIEQGMISNLITAKPEELRHFLEEAAGISKYKERRRETETRMKRTRENMERLYDIREELSKQLRKLEKQAADAQQFKLLQAERRQNQAELACIRLRKVLSDKQAHEAKVRDEEVILEGAYAQRRESETAIEAARIEIQELQDRFYIQQKTFYDIGAQITQREEAQKHFTRQYENLIREQDQLTAGLGQLEVQMSDDLDKRAGFESILKVSEPELEILEARIETAQGHFEQAQDAYNEWQAQWQAYVQESAQPRETAQVSRVKIEQHEKTVQILDERIRALETELQELSLGHDRQAIAEYKTRLHTLETGQSNDNHEVATLEQTRRDIQANIDSLSSTRAQQQAVLDQAKGRLDSLVNMQRRRLTPGQDQAQWLQSTGLDTTRLLSQNIHVEKPWQVAVERLFGIMTTGLICDEPLTAQQIAKCPSALYLFQAHWQATCDVIQNPRITLPLLQDKITMIEPVALPGWCQGVYLAEDQQQALQFRSHLQLNETILTASGELFGAGWCWIGGQDAAPGLLVLQQDIDDLECKIQTYEAHRNQTDAILLQEKARLQQIQSQLQEVQARVSQGQRQHFELAQRLSALEAKIKQVEVRQNQVGLELVHLREQLQSELGSLAECRKSLEVALAAMARFEDERIKLESQQDELQQSVGLSRDALNQDQSKARELQGQIQLAQANEERMSEQLTRTKAQQQDYRDRLCGIEQQLVSLQSERVDQNDLPELLESRSQAHAHMIRAQEALEQAQHNQKMHDQRLSKAQRDIDQLRSVLEKLRLQVQAFHSDEQHLKQELTELRVDQQDTMQQVPEHAQASVWQDKIAKIEKQVQALGAINLAAVEECQSHQERKAYMDEQYADLESALFTLEGAIEKIDQETRERFKVTFDAINLGMSDLFPRLFGGGRARLELVGDDILTAGVAIMAQPPGKKNTSIHVLSGGEKALTAISLVFSIFQLNPSPFCMLDEVDAPLDDANVQRYAKMVKHMSQKVQFIYISHNKGAMEYAEHLLGVTMQEPGVSRLVSVDVAEASAMAAL